MFSLARRNITPWETGRASGKLNVPFEIILSEHCRVGHSKLGVYIFFYYKKKKKKNRKKRKCLTNQLPHMASWNARATATAQVILPCTGTHGNARSGETVPLNRINTLA
jgi:hypothetical protein